jgi:chromosome segregation ATPase
MMAPPSKKPSETVPASSSTGTDKINAASELRWFFNRLRATMTIADDLEKIGSMENALAESQNTLKSLTEQTDDAKAKLAALKADCDAAESRAVRIVDEANARAAAVAKQSEENALANTNKAQLEAKAIVDDARKRAKDVLDRNKAAQAKYDSIIAETAEAQKKLDAVKGELAAIARRAVA